MNIGFCGSGCGIWLTDHSRFFGEKRSWAMLTSSSLQVSASRSCYILT